MKYFVCLSAQRSGFLTGGNCLTTMVIEYPNEKIKDVEDINKLEMAATEFFFEKNSRDEYEHTIMVSFQKLDK